MPLSAGRRPSHPTSCSVTLRINCSFLSDTQELINKDRLRTSDDHSSVTRGGVIAVIYKTHCMGLSEPSWGRGMGLQHSRTTSYVIRPAPLSNTGKPIALSAECALVRHGVSFFRTTADIFSAQLCSRYAHRVDSPPPPHITP